MSNNRIWKPVKGKEDWAEISSDGLIHFFATGKGRYPYERWTWGSENNGNYLNACIGGEHKGVHQWVYLTFIGPIPKGMEVNHLDENKHNNKVENLSLVTSSQNKNWGTHNAKVAAALRGLKRSDETKAKIAAAFSKPVEALDKVTGRVVFTFSSVAEAGRNGFGNSNISECCNGQRKTHKGFIWRYSNTRER